MPTTKTTEPQRRITRPRRFADPARVIVRLDQATVDALDAIAADRSISRSDVIRDALTTTVKRARIRRSLNDSAQSDS